MALLFMRATHLLTLPDELFLTEIFPYLHSSDLIRAFGTLANPRLLSLIYVSIHHLELPEEINYIEPFQHYQWNQIRSLSIHEDHLHESIASIFPSLDQLIVRLTSPMTSSISSSCLLSLFISVTRLHLSCSEPGRRLSIGKHFAGYIWHANSRIEHLSIVNCIMMNECHFLEISSSLVCNKHLTHLSLVVADLRSSIPFIALSPALEHLRVYLTKAESIWSSPTEPFLKRHQWSSRVKSLHLTAHDSYIHALCLCTFIQLFAVSLERLAFHAQLSQTYLMKSGRSFDECLLDHLPKLQHLDFCVYSGLGYHEYENRRSFDSWKHQRHVISIFNAWPGYHTRFTMPFAFDRLERVTNDFVDFHSNHAETDFILTLPSITSISFHATAPLTFQLMVTIKNSCPRLQRMNCSYAFKLHDDLIEDTQLTLPSIKKLCLFELYAADERCCRRLFSLIPHLDHLNVDSATLQLLLNAIKCPHKRFNGIRQLVIVEEASLPFLDPEIIAQEFPRADVIYRKTSF